MPHTRSKIPAGRQPELALDQRDQAAAHLLGLLVGGRLDHHAHERLGAARAHEHPPATGELVLGGAHGRVHLLRVLERAAIAHAHVDQPLRQLGHGVALAEVAPAERLQRQQRAGDAVAGAVEAHVDDVTRLLAAERPSARAQLLEHVAVADLRRADLHALALHRRVEAVVGHHRDGHAVAAQAPAGAQVQRRERHQLVAVDDLAATVDRQHAVAVAVEGEAHRVRRPRRTARASSSTCVEPQPALMLRPSGASAITDTRAPRRLKISGATW